MNTFYTRLYEILTEGVVKKANKEKRNAFLDKIGTSRKKHNLYTVFNKNDSEEYTKDFHKEIKSNTRNLGRKVRDRSVAGAVPLHDPNKKPKIP